VTAPGRQKERPSWIKKAAELVEGSNKKARSEDKYSKESKGRENKGFEVNLEAMDTPLRGKGSSGITSAKKALKTAKIASNIAATKKKKGRKQCLQKKYWPSRRQRPLRNTVSHTRDAL
jgi:hypothetical protein